MKQINNKTKYMEQPVVLCLGTFDGLHLGHRRLVEKGNEIAIDKGYKTVVFSFDNIPANFLLHKKVNRKLFTHDEKITAFKNIGIDYFWLEQFNDEISAITPYDFILYLKKVLNIKQIVVGFNYSFGSKAAGHTDDLIKYGETLGFDVFVIKSVMLDGLTVSSTQIRGYISSGQMEKAGAMLGQPFIISGKVVKGKQNGRNIKFPTINMQQEEGKIIPKFGVYATKTNIGGQVYSSITNVGIRPTISDCDDISVETNIFDFDEMCYNEHATVTFLKFIRQEMKFENLNDLKNQIALDIETAKHIMKVK